jgi:hypothetical protein
MEPVGQGLTSDLGKEGACGEQLVRALLQAAGPGCPLVGQPQQTTESGVDLKWSRNRRGGFVGAARGCVAALVGAIR